MSKMANFTLCAFYRNHKVREGAVLGLVTAREVLLDPPVEKSRRRLERRVKSRRAAQAVKTDWTAVGVQWPGEVKSLEEVTEGMRGDREEAPPGEKAHRGTALSPRSRGGRPPPTGRQEVA